MMNSLNYLIRTKLEGEEMRLMIKCFRLIQDYREKFCSKCMGTKQQKDRNCSLFRGLYRPTCRVMTRNVDGKIKKENEKLIQKIICFTVSSNAQKEELPVVFD